MAKTLSIVRGYIRQMLSDEFVSGQDLDWEDDELDLHIGICLDEISECKPYKVKEVLTTIANSRVLDISSIEDLLEIDKLEYPTGNDPRKLRNFDYLDDETIEIDTTLTPIAGGSGTLTGTVTFTNGSAAITGSSTLFTTELEVGYHIKKSTGTRWYRIYSIESATALTLAEPCLETTGADTVDVSEYCYETVYVYCKKQHSLTESSSTLDAQLERVLILGVCGRAAIAKSKQFINKVNVGGTRVWADMQTWGISKLALYKEELRGLSPPQTRLTYPKD